MKLSVFVQYLSQMDGNLYLPTPGLPLFAKSVLSPIPIDAPL